MNSDKPLSYYAQLSKISDKPPLQNENDQSNLNTTFLGNELEKTDEVMLASSLSKFFKDTDFVQKMNSLPSFKIYVRIFLREALNKFYKKKMLTYFEFEKDETLEQKIRTDFSSETNLKKLCKALRKGLKKKIHESIVKCLGKKVSLSRSWSWREAARLLDFYLEFKLFVNKEEKNPRIELRTNNFVISVTVDKKPLPKDLSNYVTDDE